MFHSNTERLIDYWRARKADRASPSRASIDPSDFTDLLPQVMILGRAAPGQYLFRLAGGLLTDLHRRDLRHKDILSLWAPTDRPRISAGIETARREGEPMVVMAEAQADGGLTCRLEILLLPLRADGAPSDRCLGLYQPLSPLTALRGRAAQELGIIRFASAEAQEGRPALRLAVVNGQRVA